jgi:hypothetical protein
MHALTTDDEDSDSNNSVDSDVMIPDVTEESDPWGNSKTSCSNSSDDIEGDDDANKQADRNGSPTSSVHSSTFAQPSVTAAAVAVTPNRMNSSILATYMAVMSDQQQATPLATTASGTTNEANSASIGGNKKRTLPEASNDDYTMNVQNIAASPPSPITPLAPPSPKHNSNANATMNSLAEPTPTRKRTNKHKVTKRGAREKLDGGTVESSGDVSSFLVQRPTVRFSDVGGLAACLQVNKALTASLLIILLLLGILNKSFPNLHQISPPHKNVITILMAVSLPLGRARVG